MADSFSKVVLLGTIPRHTGKSKVDVFAEVEFSDDGRLSISGIEGPYPSGNCYGSCGQIVMGYRTADERAVLTPAKGLDAETLDKFFDLWDRWHLNDLTAGSPRQEAFKREHPEKFDVKFPVSHYVNACVVLAEAGLNPDAEYLHDGKPYSYGHAWLTVDVPDDVVEFFRTLPDSPKALPGEWAKH